MNHARHFLNSRVIAFTLAPTGKKTAACMLHQAHGRARLEDQ
jgi:hypothetical protein